MKQFFFPLIISCLTTAHANLSLFKLPTSTHPGGKCLDGSQAGYYFEEGTRKSLFVIFLESGGYCNTENLCNLRINDVLGSSRNWPAVKGPEGNFLNRNCKANPDFCEANHVYIPYCTGDTHLGRRHDHLGASFGMYFDGQLNFEAIVKKLIAEHGMGNAKDVLLAGSSAGGMGAYFNVDWLAEQIPNAVVKAAAIAGWFFPRSLEVSKSDVYAPPDDYPHYATGTEGNNMVSMLNSTSIPLWQVKVDPVCALHEKENPETCAILDVFYKYIKSPVYAIQTQFDGDHIFVEFETPTFPFGNERKRVEHYVAMYGEATRQSLKQITDGKSIYPKPHPDGLFASSCLLHGNPSNVLIDKMNFITLVHDWFFQINKFESQHQLIESCPEGDITLPCNAEKLCHYYLEHGVTLDVIKMFLPLLPKSVVNGFKIALTLLVIGILFAFKRCHDKKKLAKKVIVLEDEDFDDNVDRLIS